MTVSPIILRMRWRAMLFLLLLFSNAVYTNPVQLNPMISISDPCTCLNNATTLSNGQFAEAIEVNAPTGETWIVISINGLYEIGSPSPPALPTPISTGTVLSESPMGSGIYLLEGIHIDAVGYSVTVENGVGEQLSISNTCYYPNIEILNLEEDVCLNTAPIPLEGDAGGVNGTGTFTINGSPETIFDPFDLGVGTHFVTYTFDAGDATSNELSDPGCISSVTELVNVIETASTIACNGKITVALDGNCEALISPDLVLEGTYDCTDDYFVLISYQNDSVPNPVPGDYIGKSLQASVIHLPSNNFCWGYLEVEDKLPPVIDCQDVTIQCYQSAGNVPSPSATDNCDANPKENLVDESIDDSDPCQGVTITRTWLAFDDYDNISDTCIQVISIAPPHLPTFPSDRIWKCDEYFEYPNIVQANPFTGDLSNTGSGVPTNINGIYCMYDVDFSDQLIQTCGNNFKIIRTWVIFDWCNNQLVNSGANGEDNIQIIEVADQTPPKITHNSFSVGTTVLGNHPEPCRSTDFLSTATVSDDCSAYSLKIFTPVGEAIYLNGVNGLGGGYIPAPGLTQGNHIITYQAEDACGNISELEIEITVVDDVAPSAICDELTAVSISSAGQAEVFAEVFDDGSFDNCCVDRFEIRKMEDFCDNPSNLEFGESIAFCCEDATQNPHDVAFRIWDCAGNYNVCMIQVKVEDKQNPYAIECPGNQNINCDYYIDNIETYLNLGQYEVLDQFGAPEFYDNCSFSLSENVLVSIDECGNGNITRTFQAEDPSLNVSNTCTQIIFVQHISDWVIEFPADLTANCDLGDVPDFGEPNIFFESCELLAYSFEDEIFTVVTDACYKIVRNWTAINWCVVGAELDQETLEDAENQLNIPFPDCDLDGDGDCDDRTFGDSRTSTGVFDSDPDPDNHDGFITYQQVIKVIDNLAPQIICPEEFLVCIVEGCLTDVLLPSPEVVDCSSDITLTALSALGNGFGPFSEVESGKYLVIYTASDNCGNSAACQFEFTVEDCKKPTPYCKNGFVVDLMNTNPPMIEVNAENLDDGSFDNCSMDLTFSFSADVSNQTMTFGCNEIGQQNVAVWVTDASGNQDFCQTFIIVQDNNDLCIGDPIVSVSGLIATEMGENIKDVKVQLSGGTSPDQTTGNDGMYDFSDIQGGGDYTIVPSKDINPLNGVTTFDLVLISKHILNTQKLDSPYKIIAADANNSGTVTTLDLVLIRKLILHIDSDFQNNTSWRFVPKDYEFSDPEKPGKPMEVITINNLNEAMPNTDFIGIKTGDVNNSVDPINLLGSDDRSFEGKVYFEAENSEIRVGEEFEVVFKMANFEQIQGFQFTLNFDTNAIEFIDIVESEFVKKEHFGLKLLKNGAITSSWNSASEFSNIDQQHIGVFSLKFKSLVNKDLKDLLHLSSEFTKAEAYDQEENILELDLQIKESGLVFAYDGNVKLFQNHPNPFAQTTIISFSLPEASRTSISLVDITGKTLKVIKQHLETGTHEVEINRSDLGSPGIYFFQLETEEITLIQKLILSSY